MKQKIEQLKKDLQEGKISNKEFVELLRSIQENHMDEVIKNSSVIQKWTSQPSPGQK